MPSEILGKVKLTPGGTFVTGATYEPLTMVDYLGSSYVSKVSVSNVIPGESANWQNYWQLAAQKGTKGDRGPGRSILTIFKTDTAGLVDTYEITYDAEPFANNFEVTNGERGTVTYAGDVITGTSITPTAYETGITNAIVNDRYRNTDNASESYMNEYRCTEAGDEDTALWIYDGNVRGAIGATNAVDGVAAGIDGNVVLGAVRYSVAQTLESSEQQQARENIGAQEELSASNLLPITSGGTGAGSASEALTALGAQAALSSTNLLPITSGGTGAANAADARTALGAQAALSSSNLLPVTSGGTGSGNAADARAALGAQAELSASNLLPITSGGTGAGTASGARDSIGAANSNINVLHNADWRTPINQRVHTGAVSNAYCIDRWIGNGTVTPVSGQYVTLANGTTMIQRMEILPSKILSKTFTFSVDIGGTIQTAHLTYPSTTTGSPASASLTGISVSVGFVDLGAGITTNIEGVERQYIPYLQITATAAVNIVRVKLENGTTSTLSADSDQSRQEAWDQCNRYLVKWTALVRLRSSIYLTNLIDFIFPLPCVMRSSPALIGTLEVATTANVTQSGFTFTIPSFSDSLVTVRATKTSHGLTDGVVYPITTPAFFSAEL